MQDLEKRLKKWREKYYMLICNEISCHRDCTKNRQIGQ